MNVYCGHLSSFCSILKDFRDQEKIVLPSFSQGKEETMACSGGQVPEDGVAQQVIQMMQHLVTRQSQLQQAVAEAFTQQVTVSSNIDTSTRVDFRGRSEPEGFSKA